MVTDCEAIMHVNNTTVKLFQIEKLSRYRFKGTLDGLLSFTPSLPFAKTHLGINCKTKQFSSSEKKKKKGGKKSSLKHPYSYFAFF